jgi:hypothetical protein
MTDLFHPTVQTHLALREARTAQSQAKAAYDRAVTIGSTQARSKCEKALRDATTRVMALEALL